MKLVEKGIRAKDIVTMESFENAVMVHAAISGSTNATMHLPAIAHEFGFTIDADTFDRMHRGAHYLLNIRPSGDWPAQYFYYAGGVPRVTSRLPLHRPLPPRPCRPRSPSRRPRRPPPPRSRRQPRRPIPCRPRWPRSRSA